MGIKFNPAKSVKAQELRLRNRATAELWRRGDVVDILLKGRQKDIYELYKINRATPGITSTFALCTRRGGKSFTAFAIAISECIQKSNYKVLYLSTTTEQVREITGQISESVLETCPADMKPFWKSKESKFVFPNGSEIRVKGLDKVGGSAIRGVKADLVIFDEACFMQDLRNIVESIVSPMIVAENGHIIFASTPPDTPGHESISIIAQCEANNALIKYTIDDTLGVLYNEQQLEAFERTAGGRKSTVFKREYLAQIVVETNKAILPSFSKIDEADLVQTVVFPTQRDDIRFYPDTYVGMDLGFRDLTVALFGYWDYPNARIVIQSELVWKDKQATTSNIASDIKQMEKKLWGREAGRRTCDNDLRFIHDIKNEHGIRFFKTAKDNKEAQVNMLNIMLNDGQIVIDPSCKTLLAHMKYGIWKENRREFERTKELYHCDAIDALIYLMRSIKRHRNPIPASYNSPFSSAMHDAGTELNTESGRFEGMKRIFRR